GICGKASIDLVRQEARPLSTAPRLDPTVLHSLREQLDSQQPVFDVTGGLHAAGIGGPTGTLRVVREDIGRHNAVDKSVGALLRANDGGLSTSVLLVSGRASFEVVQKAL